MSKINVCYYLLKRRNIQFILEQNLQKNTRRVLKTEIHLKYLEKGAMKCDKNQKN